MADALLQNHQGVPENFSKQLAVSVRSIQWSYAIFWDLSTTQQGVLAWVDGYYNGDVKTRKTALAMELKADQIGLQRSEQLRELYESLQEDETDQQVKRPSVSLSPEDLSDAEWYYLVCMSFVFRLGQGLPGKALANGETIWLYNAQLADSKTFSRSLLAKSASIQTVVCFPYLGGVVELGVTDLVSEDPSLLQHFKASLLDFSKPVCSEKLLSIPENTDKDKDQMYATVDDEIVDTLAFDNLYSLKEPKFDQESTVEEHGDANGELNMDSPDDCSNGCEHNHQSEDSFILEGIDDGASQVQSFMNDDYGNGVSNSMNSGDCISRAVAHQEEIITSAQHGYHQSLREVQEGNHTKLSSLNLGTDDDLHYKRTVAAILKSSHQMIGKLCFRSLNYKSNFLSWKKGGKVDVHKPLVQQNMLKRILFTVPLMNSGHSLRFEKENDRKNCLRKLESNDDCAAHVVQDRRRENEKFLLLRSMVPSITESDKAAILNDTLRYLKELEARIEQLEESSMDSTNFGATIRRNHLDTIEWTSDNSDNKKFDNDRRPWINKRKACDVDETDLEPNRIVLKKGLQSDVKVDIKDQEVQVQMRCPYREYILLDIMDALNNLYLEAYSVQSDAIDGTLTLTIQSKFRGTAVSSAGMIKEVLWKIAG